MPTSRTGQRPGADRITAAGRSYRIHPISGIPGAEGLPYSLKILLENLVRTRDDRVVTPGEADYYRHGGIMPYVLRNLLRGAEIGA